MGHIEDLQNFRITRSETISAQRAKINMDTYATFKWRGAKSYEDFGCFITNNKNLSWVSKPNFSDEYTKPMFQSNRVLSGTTFTNKSISLTLGVYWITRSQYREFLNWMNPEIIGNLELDYNKGWSYKVKISKISNGVFYSIGYDGSENVYYVELTVTFDTIEDNYTTYNLPWEYFSKIQTVDSKQAQVNYFPATNVENEIATEINFSTNISLTANTNYKIWIAQLNTDGTIDLDTKLTLVNFTAAVSNYEASLKYNSLDGVVLINNKLLSNLVVTTSGSEIISDYSVNKFLLPGSLNNDFWNYNVTVLNNVNNNVKVFSFVIGVESIYQDNTILIYPKREI